MEMSPKPKWRATADKSGHVMKTRNFKTRLTGGSASLAKGEWLLLLLKVQAGITADDVWVICLI